MSAEVKAGNGKSSLASVGKGDVSVSKSAVKALQNSSIDINCENTESQEETHHMYTPVLNDSLKKEDGIPTTSAVRYTLSSH